jgi:hypothetical protein
MKRLFEISSEEKQRILEMHESATKRNYLMEADPINPPKQVTTKPAQTSQPTDTQTEGIDINGVKYKLTNVVKDAASLTKFLDYNPEEDYMGTFCLYPGYQCGGMLNVSFAPYADGKPSYWTMMKEYAKMFLNEVALNYSNKIIAQSCTENPGRAIYFENMQQKLIPLFKQKYGLDDKKFDDFNKYFGTMSHFRPGLESALREQLTKVGACSASNK